MKKLIILIIIFNFLTASEKTLYKHTKIENNTIEEILIGFKKDFISKINYIIPAYLNINPEKSFFNLSAEYSTLSHKTDVSFSLHLRLPSFKIEKKTEPRDAKKQISENFTSVKFKIRPYIRLKKGKIKTFLSNSFTIEKHGEFNLTFLQKFDYYLNSYWEESTQFSINKNQKTSTLTISTNKDEKNNLFYTLGFYRHTPFYKKIFILGYELSGEKNRSPFFYSHTWFISYRQNLFHTKRVYYEIKPFILYSKAYNFKLKEAVELSIHYKF
ncbi:hypothetical protein [Nautilia lithotrophica]